MKTMENQKNKKNKQWILDGKNGSLTPIVFTTNGDTSTETKLLYVKNHILTTVIIVRGLNNK